MAETHSTSNIQILHNTKCSKSREGWNWLQENVKNVETIEYLKDNLTENELKSILKKLNIPAIDWIRKEEKIWKENYQGKKFSDDKLIKIMAENPNLIQRPVVIKGNKAVIGRPLEKIIALLSES